MAQPSPSVGPPPDWADQAADAVVNLVDVVRDRTTGQVLTAARAIVYGFIGVFAVIVALVLAVIGLIRLVDVVLPGEVWSAYFLLGTLFVLGGLLVWRRRAMPEPASA